ncbi:hypothetical protein K458DRAFT_52789 [Lentithecium fluviatile CBS 122367]|uniref:C2H2-type domain-containing protein n=1 Tax=Lentithecium fluviatile CBS 122367 TaxID=1168545 RepID=A0A6G1IXL1_9PLEO|nr:hypothetical protein K458DRAFT_52789 [Lentithecium fluviatile CBS 122367]
MSSHGRPIGEMSYNPSLPSPSSRDRHLRPDMPQQDQEPTKITHHDEVLPSKDIQPDAIPANLRIRRVFRKVLTPLSCGYCKMKFTGQYQKGNLTRHVRTFHVTTTAYNCRTCPKTYLRDDARRKHEWKKHRAEDCRPEKRRQKKLGSEDAQISAADALNSARSPAGMLAARTETE